jgi:alkylated DNA repair protein (DNA oxidative demethylase)
VHQTDPEIALGENSFVLRNFAGSRLSDLMTELLVVVRQAPFRHMLTPGGKAMSVAMTNCGALGWISDRRGYRYSHSDPETDAPWPQMPRCFAKLAQAAADAVGFREFTPDACLVNRYTPGARMSLHQDKDERDFGAPIVSVSLGLNAIFLFGGNQRGDKPRRVPLGHGDVVVWGGSDRLRFHGVAPLKEGTHEVLGAHRINLTFRKAG